MSKKRIFVGIGIPCRVREKMFLANRRFEDKLDALKKVRKENIHLTLRFIGYVSNDGLKDVLAAVSKTVEDMKRFTFELSGEISAFSSKKSANVIYFEIGHGIKDIIQIKKILEKNLSLSGFEKDYRKYIPHITISRLRKRSCIKDIDLNIRGLSGEEIKCNSVNVYESILKSTGTEYIVIEEFLLK